MEPGKSKYRKADKIRAQAKEQIAQAKEAIYQLEYLKALYPGIQDVLEMDYKDLPMTGEIPDHDPVRDYLSKEEWQSLSVSEKNQLALNRYVDSRNKTKWQIGRDYELYVGYFYEKKGYKVEYTGSYLRLEDMGRDLIARKYKNPLIIQCKYWSKEKQIHEKHIFQLYGSVVCYNIEHAKEEKAKGLFITNTVLSDTAMKVAEQLKIKVIDNFEISEFPRIKCNIGVGEDGQQTRIYHLPIDLQYDNVKLDKPGECKVFNVYEAEALGFRRAYKWHGN